jgi:hypothetical protein
MVAAVLMTSSEALRTNSAMEITMTIRTCNGTPPAAPCVVIGARVLSETWAMVAEPLGMCASWTKSCGLAIASQCRNGCVHFLVPSSVVSVGRARVARRAAKIRVETTGLPAAL